MRALRTLTGRNDIIDAFPGSDIIGAGTATATGAGAGAGAANHTIQDAP